MGTGLSVFVLAAPLLAAGGEALPDRRPLSVDDALALVRVGDVALTPDGERVFYSERRANWEENDYETEYFLVSSRGGEAEPFVGEDGGDDFRFSPDGERLTFLRERDGEEQVFALPLSGGEARPLTAHPGGVESYRWSPDGRRLFYTAEEPRAADEQAERDAGGDAVFVGEGPNDLDAGLWTNLWVLELASGEERRLTDHELVVEDFDVAPDGARVVFQGLSDTRTNYFYRSELYLVNASGGLVVQLTDNDVPEEGPRWSPDGTRIAYRATDDEWFDLRHGYVWILNPSTGESRRLDGQREGESGGLTWMPDGGSLLLYESRGVDTNLYELDVESGELVARTAVRGTLRPRAFSTDRSRMVYTFEDFTRPADLYAADLAAAEPVRLTRSNPWVEDEIALGRGEVVRWRSRDGREIEGTLVLPAGHDGGEPLPLVMCIHGGPPGYWGNSFEPDFHRFAGLGYAVFGPNPRGSSSYGEDHLRALMGDVGGGEFDDLMTGVDALVERGVADPERLALRGWSWGGILGAWTIAHTDRFRAASLGAMVGDWFAETGGGLMFDLELHYIQTPPWKDPAEWRKRSALTYVANVTTPTLLLHGEEDGVSTVNQSMMFYTALRARGVPVRFIKFPRQGHGIREPRLARIADVEEVAWIERHVRGVRLRPEELEEAEAADAERPDWLEPGRELTALDRALIDRMQRARVPGLAAAVVADGEVLFTGAYGWADVEARVPVTDETVFQLAPVTKTVTACAVMQLVEAGELDLDADVNDVLPFSVRHPDHPDVPITLRRLLTHTAAIRDNWVVLEGTWVLNGDFPMSLRDSLAAYLVPGGELYSAAKSYPKWAPGAKRRYSNVGIALAALVAEERAGVPFEELCRRRIFEPLGMGSSGFRQRDVDMARAAMPHRWTRRGAFEPEGHHSYLDYPAGTLRASAPQLARFLLAFIGDGELDGVRVLQPGTVREMRRIQYPELGPDQGLVWYRDELGGHELLGHDGGDPGVATQMYYRPADGVGFVLLMNGEPRGRGAERGIVRELLRFADGASDGSSEE